MATFVHVTCSGMKLTNNYKMGGRDLSADVYRILRSNTFPCASKQLFCPHHGRNWPRWRGSTLFELTDQVMISMSYILMTAFVYIRMETFISP